MLAILSVTMVFSRLKTINRRLFRIFKQCNTYLVHYSYVARGSISYPYPNDNRRQFLHVEHRRTRLLIAKEHVAERRPNRQLSIDQWSFNVEPRSSVTRYDLLCLFHRSCSHDFITIFVAIQFTNLRSCTNTCHLLSNSSYFFTDQFIYYTLQGTFYSFDSV